MECRNREGLSSRGSLSDRGDLHLSVSLPNDGRNQCRSPRSLGLPRDDKPLLTAYDTRRASQTEITKMTVTITAEITHH